MVATLYYRNGTLAGWRQTAEEAAQFPIPLGHSLLEFDAKANPALVDALNTRWNDLSVLDGALLLDGKLVVVNPDSDDESERKALPSAVTLLNAYLDLATPTAAQREAALRALIRLTLWRARNEF